MSVEDLSLVQTLVNQEFRLWLWKHIKNLLLDLNSNNLLFETICDVIGRRLWCVPGRTNGRPVRLFPPPSPYSSALLAEQGGAVVRLFLRSFFHGPQPYFSRACQSFRRPFFTPTPHPPTPLLQPRGGGGDVGGGCRQGLKDACG